MSSSETKSAPAYRAPLFPVMTGVFVFLAALYGGSLWRLAMSSGDMNNKFSALAHDKYLGFLIRQNLMMVVAYLLLAFAAGLLAQPLVSWWAARWQKRSFLRIAASSLVVALGFHIYFTLRLYKTRPYFINTEEFGHWYYKALDFIPQPGLFAIFTLLPIGFLIGAVIWHVRTRGRWGWVMAGVTAAIIGTSLSLQASSGASSTPASSVKRPMNVIIIGSDSLRGDKLGCAGYRPARSDGAAAAGVSPHIDALAARSANFERCYTGIASTMESGVQLMSSQYPQSHGIRQMYPDRETVQATEKRIVPIASVLRKQGYDTTVIGDWCAGYYDVVRLGFENISASSFDTFKTYMSQAVVMAHSVVPLYFDNSLGRRLFPQIESFASFVKPKVVTDRVDKRLELMAREQKPFFWHVFFSCNHLPYASEEPYNTMFSDPAYQGDNKGKVNFDIDSFIGGTDLESKWKALPESEVKQIRALFDGCTRQFDDCVKSILDSVKRHGLEDNTIVIITSDHGDDHYEPGVTLGHGLTFNGGLYANHVPMIVHVPGTAPKRIPEIVRLIDVVPTVADLLGVEKSPTWQGRSFAGWIRGSEKPEHRPFYGETGFPFVQFSVPGVKRPKLPPMDESTWIDEDYNYQFVLKPEYLPALIAAKQRCLRTRDWKIVCTPTVEGTRHFGLFHLSADPEGMTDVAASRPDVLAPMKAAIERWMDEKIESSIADIFPQGEP